MYYLFHLNNFPFGSLLEHVAAIMGCSFIIKNFCENPHDPNKPEEIATVM